MIDCDYQGRGNKHADIPVKREKRERTENMKMSFDPAVGQVHEDCGPQHLRDCHDMASPRPVWPQYDQRNRQCVNDGASGHREHDMQMSRSNASLPHIGRNSHCQYNRQCPLDQKHPNEHAASGELHLLQDLVEYYLGADADLITHRGHPYSGWPSTRLSTRPLSKSRTLSRPRLSPPWPRMAVIPPEKMRAPLRS